MTSSGVHHARKSNAADDKKDQQIGNELRGTGHWATPGMSNQLVEAFRNYVSTTGQVIACILCNGSTLR